MAATAKGDDLTAPALIADGKKAIQGGGSDKDPTFAMAGGRDAAGIDAALDAARSAAGL